MDQMGANMFGSGLGGFLGGLFGDSGSPYKKAMGEYDQYGNRVQNANNPFLQAGQGAIGPFQQWLQGQKDPSGFINGMMGQYQESPWAHNLQNQSMRAGVNAASMGGLPNGMGGAGTGSTPFAQQMQQNSSNIASGDMNQWLQNVLGINTQYGTGLSGMMRGGQDAANSLTGFWNNQADRMGQAAYGKEHERQNDRWNMFGGLGNMGSGLAMMAGGV